MIVSSAKVLQNLPDKDFHLKIFIALILFTACFYLTGCSNLPKPPDAAQMIINLSKVVPMFMQLVTATSYLLGISFTIRALWAFKQYGESRTMMSSSTDLKLPLTLLIVGAALLYLPSTVWSSLDTFWTNPNPYGYEQEFADQSIGSQFMLAMYQLVQLFGVIAFIRGWLLLSQTAGHSAAPGTMGKALAHIIGGILAINLYDLWKAVVATLWGTST